MTQQARRAYTVGDDLNPVVKTITQEMIGRYAVSSGDGNPLHTDPDFAAATQFGGTIAHGMLVLAYLSEMLTAAFGEGWVAGGRMKARFRAPARPGDTVTAGGRVTKAEAGTLRCEAECWNQAGEVLITADVEVPA
ncbi:MAG TPA: MaoC family dehydratase [Dehalococcoidia bacterium]|nr:MaoC family dehydratase [Dehalococcoidia bacterium]